MDRIAIIYVSLHHHNTKKVIEEMAEQRALDIIKLSEAPEIDWSQYKYIGFASGVYFQQLHKGLLALAAGIALSAWQKTFIVYTCGFNYKNYARTMEATLKRKPADFIGTFHCRGYDTYGWFKFIGGIAKNHPNSRDLRRARVFVSSI